MSFDYIVKGLNHVHAESASNSFFVSQVQTRANNVFNFLVEAWNIIVSLGEVFKNLVGLAARTVLWLPRHVLNLSGLNNLYDAFPGCNDARNSIVKTVQLAIGAFSTATLGVVVNPNWNHSVHVAIGIVPKAPPVVAAAAAVVA